MYPFPYMRGVDLEPVEPSTLGRGGAVKREPVRKGRVVHVIGYATLPSPIHDRGSTPSIARKALNMPGKPNSVTLSALSGSCVR